MLDFAGLHEAVSVTYLLDDGNVFVVVMCVVQVDIIGLKTLQGFRQGSFDIFDAETRTRWQSTHFGSDDEVVPVTASRVPFTENLLRLATFVAFGHTEYRSAVSMKFPPASTKVSGTAKDASRSEVQPKVLPPRLSG